VAIKRFGSNEAMEESKSLSWWWWWYGGGCRVSFGVGKDTPLASSWSLLVGMILVGVGLGRGIAVSGRLFSDPSIGRG
jgi:hypothetical protein